MDALLITDTEVEGGSLLKEEALPDGGTSLVSGNSSLFNAPLFNLEIFKSEFFHSPLFHSPFGQTMLVALTGLVLLLLAYWISRFFASPQDEPPVDVALLGARRLLLQRFEGDEWGAVSETVLQLLRPRFKRTFFSGPSRPYVGVNAASSGREKSGMRNGSQPLDVTLQGKVTGRHLQIDFYPPSPGFQNIAEAQAPVVLTDEAVIYNRDEPEFAPCYASYDIPLSRLEGLTVQLPGLQKALLGIAVNGVLARGFGLSGHIYSADKLTAEGEQFAGALAGLEKTQPVLHQEMKVLAAWCFLIAGLMRREESLLRRSAGLYQSLDKAFWSEREGVFWAGIKANQAMAAFALMQLAGEGRDEGAAAHQLIESAQEAVRYFQRDNFPTSWGRLMIMLGRGALEVPEAFRRRAGGDDADRGEGIATFMGRVDSAWLERQLDQAIDYWRRNQQVLAIAEAYFAKGRLAQTKARQHEGLQDWERAENAFLGALSIAPLHAPWWSVSRADVQLALGRLYLNWGTDFGERGLLEKAMHYLPPLIEAGGRLAGPAELALAQCYLNLGGVSNEAAAHQRALDYFTLMQEKAPSGALADEVARGVGVARARLALLQGDLTAARLAVSEISSVLGHAQQGHLARDVLLRLRARLRELIFTLEGDDIALDRAIQDRRELVAIAEMNVSDLRWAVETRDLVGLLTRRQYKALGKPRDFHEAHFLIEKCLSVCQADGSSLPLVLDGLALRGEGDYRVQHIKATLYRQLGRLLASFARLQFDVKALNEAADAFEAYLKLTPRERDGEGRAEVLHQIGQIHLDCSAHYGKHEGLRRARACYAEAFDIYLAVGKMDQANRMHRFLEAAEAALFAYQPGDEMAAPRQQEG